MGEGKIEELLYEGQTLQGRLKWPNSSMIIAKISMKFRILMSKGNVNGALKVLTHAKWNFTTYRHDTTATETKAS